MQKYHKIQTVYLRDPQTKYKTLLEGQYTLPEFEYLANNEWVFTEKVDGTNIRVDWDLERVTFGGRTDNAQIPTFLYSKLQEKFLLNKFLELYPETPMTLYGEGYGARIQKGGVNYISDGVDFILFDVMIGENYLSRDNVEDIGQCLGINVVPIIGAGPLADAIDLAMCGFQSDLGQHQAEGLVMRPKVELKTRIGRRIITKIKCKDFN
jgi:ATP-dependent RNA circularization protein (DNA/RNA ligase family)